MAVNLDSSKGLIVGEAVMMGLAPLVGRNAAHDIVYESCKECIEDGQSTLYDHLAKRAEVTEKISTDQLRSLCDPRNYLGAAQRMVDDVLSSVDRGSKRSAKLNGLNGHGNTVNDHLNGNGHVNGNGHLNGDRH